MIGPRTCAADMLPSAKVTRALARPVVLAAISGLISGLVFQGSRHIYDSTEGRYCLVAREMVESGNWLEPTLLGQPHWSKPPLTYWVLAAAIKLLGRNEWAVRLPNAVFFAISCAAVAGLGVRLWGALAGALAGVVYATSVYPVVVANTVNTDTLLAMWELVALYALLSVVRGSVAAVYWFWLLEGMAFSTKGPPGLIPVVAGLGFLVIRRRYRLLRRWLAGPALLVFLVSGLWWYIWAVAKHPGLLQYFIKDELLGRVVANEFNRYPQWYAPLTVYGPCLLLGSGVWSIYLFSAIRRWSLWRWSEWRNLMQRSDPVLFLACWFVPGLVIFSLSSSRLHNYVLPLFGAVVLVIARRAVELWSGTRRSIVLVGIISFLVVAVAKAAPVFTETRRDMGRLYRALRPLEQEAQLTVLYRERQCYGFSFYAEKPVYRCHHLAGETEPAVWDCSELLRETGTEAASAKGMLFVASAEASRELEVFLAVQGFDILRRVTTRHWCGLLARRSGIEH